MKKKNLIFAAVGVGLLAAAAVGGFSTFKSSTLTAF